MRHHRASPLTDAIQALPTAGCNRSGDLGLALVLDHLDARPREEAAAMLEALALSPWRTGRREVQAAATLWGQPGRGQADAELLQAYCWKSHAVLASWLPEPARLAAEQAWHTLHAQPRPPMAALVNLAELHRQRGELGPARMLLGEAQKQLVLRPGERYGVADRDYAPLLEALDQCNAGTSPDLDLALLSDRELWFLLEAPDRADLRTDLWCTWRDANHNLRVRLRGVFSGTWLGPLPGPRDPVELVEAERVRARLLESLG